MDEILWCYHSNETSSAVLSRGTIYLVCSSNFGAVDEILRCDHSNETSLPVHYFHRVLFVTQHFTKRNLECFSVFALALVGVKGLK